MDNQENALVGDCNVECGAVERISSTIAGLTGDMHRVDNELTALKAIDIAAALNEIRDKFDVLLAQGRDQLHGQELLESKLLGSKEDGYKAGRLPILERELESLKGRVDLIEESHEKEAGATGILFPFLRWAGALFIATIFATLGALARWAFVQIWGK